MFTTTCLPVDFCSGPGGCEFLPQTGSGEWKTEPLFQLKVFFENIISCLQRFELLCCTAASQYSTCNTRRICSGLDPQLVSHHQAGIVSPGLLKIPAPGEQSESRRLVACRVLGQEQVNKGPHGLLGQASHVTLRVGGPNPQRAPARHH